MNEHAENFDEGLDDISLTPDGFVGGSGGSDLLRERELNFFSHEPYLTLTLANGNRFYLYPKSKGQLNQIARVRQKMVDAGKVAEDKLSKGWWSKRYRKIETTDQLDNVATAEYEYYRAIFEDAYIPERHQDFDVADYLALTPDAMAAIRKAFEESNDASMWVKTFNEDRGKKKQVEDQDVEI